jgi:hypothetical protein
MYDIYIYIDSQYKLLSDLHVRNNFSVHRIISLVELADKSSCLVPASEFPNYNTSSTTTDLSEFLCRHFDVAIEVIYGETETINTSLLVRGPAVTDKMTEESA